MLIIAVEATAIPIGVIKAPKYINPKDTAICRTILNHERFCIYSDEVSDTFQIAVSALYTPNKIFKGFESKVFQETPTGRKFSLLWYWPKPEPHYDYEETELYDVWVSQHNFILYWINLLFKKSQQDKEYSRLLRYWPDHDLYALQFAFFILPYPDESSNSDNAPK